MIGLRQLSHHRLELYASRFPMAVLKTYVLEHFKGAFATIVLYEDNIEAYHETGIFMFNASEPETFNYEEFRAPLVAEFRDRVAVCTVENLFLHLERYMDEKPMEDDPFHNLVFSLSTSPPSRELLLDWERNLDSRLRRVLYDDASDAHFHLFPFEQCVVYSHGNHFTSVTSDQTELIRSLYRAVLEAHLKPVCRPPLPDVIVDELYERTKTMGSLRLKAERLYQHRDNGPFLLVTYTKLRDRRHKLIAKLALDDNGVPTGLSDTVGLAWLPYFWRYTDWTILPMLLLLALMIAVVVMGVYFQVLFPQA